MIVVFGSLNMDLVFPVDALPRPGETTLGGTYHRAAGGKGANQAAAAALAGADCRMVGCVGDDAFGQAVVAALGNVGVDVERVERVAAPTGCAAVTVDAQGENQIVVAGGANLEARASQVPDAWLGPETTLVMQCEVPPKQNWILAKRAQTRGARIVLNAAPARPIPSEVGQLLDVLIVNEQEAAAIAAELGLAVRVAVKLAEALAERVQTQCVLTLGAAGALTAGHMGVNRASALEIEAVDTTAAGDTFVGYFAAALDRGLDVTAALHRASVAGGLACTKLGAFPSLPCAREVDAHLECLAPPNRITG